MTGADQVSLLRAEVARKDRIIEVLMDRVEKSSRSFDGSDLFARNAELQWIVSRHTAALKEAYSRLESESRERAAAENERQELQTRLAEQDRMVSVGTLAAGVAHEINSPIQFIGDNAFFLDEALAQIIDYMGLCETALLTALGPDDERVRALAHESETRDLPFLKTQAPLAVARISEGSGRVASIVKAMRSFAHQGPGTLTEANINEAIKNALVLSNNALKYIAEVETSLGEIPLMWCDIGALHQVFLNLFQNAGQAIEDTAHGSRLGRLSVRSWVEGNCVQVEVSDTGCGMSPEVRARAFDPFFTTKPIGRGTGQGLSISRSIVHRHQGRITVVDRPGWSTTLRVELPLITAT